MSASSKFDLSSNSPDRPLYSSGQRGSYAAASLDRSVSFRENLESPTLPAIANMTRGSSTATQGDVMSFFQCLRFDPKAMVTDHKLNRPVDFKRLASVSLGIPLEDSPSVPAKGKPVPSPSPEQFRRLRASIRDGCRKARERVKIFNESLSVMNKWFPIPSRKRSRSDALSSDRSNAFYAADRSVSGTSMTKMGAQSHVSINGFEVEQKSEERTKNSLPNKRTRTSMVDPRMDARANTPARPSGTADRDREVLKIPNSSAVQSEDRTLPVGVDGWEKSKMKKKRSGIKQDGAASSVAAKPIDGSRDSKQGMQPRLLTDARSRLSDNHGFRPGIANGGVGKTDGAPQQIGSGTRSSIARIEQDNSPLLYEKRDRPLEKERVTLKAINKTSAREDFSSGSPTSSTKLIASARAPRSGSSVGPKSSPVVSRATAANDWEISQCTSKISAAVGVNSRKRTPSMRSSSPPVAHWASQRPQKISRTARRTNFIPIVQSNDESSVLDTTSVGIGNERRLSGSSPQQVKLKNDTTSSAALSESEESGTAEMKFKDKTKKSDDMDEKAAQNVQKMSNLMLPPRKNKVISGEDHGDGVRRQGRTGRGFTSTRSLMPLTGQKLGNLGTAKQLRSARLGFDKTESKAGRPPTRKPSDRKAYTRQKHIAVSAAADFLDDGHEELFAAANAVINPAQALSGSFWKQMEPCFRFVSDLDVTYLKQQVDSEPNAASPVPASSGMENNSLVANGFGSNEIGRGGIIKTQSGSQDYLSCGTKTLDEVSLYQRLMSALIQEGDDEFCCSSNEDLRFDVCDSGFELETNLSSEGLPALLSQNSDLSRNPVTNGYMMNANGRSFNELEHVLPDNNGMSISNTGTIPSYNNSQNGSLPECTVGQYNNMSINERLLLEIHSIGIFPELAPDFAHTRDEEISSEVCKLNEIYSEQVSKRKGLICRLLKSAAETRELQNKEFEQHALDKIVIMAYEKYMACWGPNAHGMKSAGGKMAKQAAFVKRTLVRCQEFEETGKSCFNEPLYRGIFLAGCSRLGDELTGDSIDGESGKHGVRPIRTSMSAQQSPSLANQEMYLSDNPPSASEQFTGKEDILSNRVKKKELLLDDVGGGAIGVSSAVPSGIGNSFSSSAKGKRSERDREGKGGSREAMSRSGTTKLGRPTSANFKGEKKSKSKPKHKTTQLSASVNGLLGKMPEKPKGTLPSTQKTSDASSRGIGKDKSDYSLDELEDPIDLSGLQIPEMDDLGVPDDLGGQGQDIGSWLNIDDEALQDHDFMGLQIPMDDLSELNMMV